MFRKLDGLARLKRVNFLFSDVKVGLNIKELVGLFLLAVCEHFLLSPSRLVSLFGSLLISTLSF